MATAEKVKAAIAIACIAAISIAASMLYVSRRRGRQRRGFSEVEDKPQNRFKRVLADNSYAPFKHFKREGQEKEISVKTHPYEEEIAILLKHPPVVEFISSHERLVMSSSYIWIDTKSNLQLLAELLSKERVFAVDTEQHSIRSFLGFTALMQISTQKEDFLLDTIALHDVMSILQPVFVDRSICKVFHGADNDVLWLQRDFHIYVVNMFDTAKACEVLAKPHKSLSYLLETYCGVSTDKTLQREDWRVRPLSADMIQYACTDAHYLLYIADCLASELRRETTDISACPDDKLNFFFEASHRSNMVCMQLYVKEIETPPGASAAASLFSRNCNFQGDPSSKSCETKDLVWNLCAWRDLMARIHDESLRYILSDQAIVALAAKVPNDPMEVYEVISAADLSSGSLNVYSSIPSPSPVVMTHTEELCCLLEDRNAHIDEIFRRYIHRHLDCDECCSLSVYNYALLSQLSSEQSRTIFSRKNGAKVTAPVGKKASREVFVQKFSCKSPVYHNCRIYASDGRLLCYCDRRKLEWYLRRDLAKIIEENPPAIMLLFEPKGRPEDEDNDFYIQSKKNICVGCGEKSHYLRYRIIPSCYRMHFPEHLKSHRSHDIVLLCVDCHEIAHSAAEKYKKNVASEFQISLFVQKISDSGKSDGITLPSGPEGREMGVHPLQLRTAAMALLRHGSSMPSKRHDELTQIVKSYFGGREISQEDLELALLVGMSPHERRRLEKKKGLTFKHHKESSINKTEATTVRKLVCDTKTDGTIQDLQESSKGDTKGIDEEKGVMSVGELDADTVLDEDSSLNGDNEQSFDEELEQENVCSKDSDGRNGDISHENGASCYPFKTHQIASARSAKKLSLLGHGPHGKQVVEHLLNKYGEDGIRQFCQRWRQVFVEAINPRFLPSGWDIMHSGRRDFGDFSVYNPAKKILDSVSS